MYVRPGIQGKAFALNLTDDTHVSYDSKNNLCSLYAHVYINKIFEGKIVNIFLPIRFNMFWVPKRTGSSEYPQHRFG